MNEKITAICSVCRKEVDPTNGVLLGTMGKPFLIVHTDPCAKWVKTGVGLLGQAAVTGVTSYLRQAFPKLMATTETVINQVQNEFRKQEL